MELRRRRSRRPQEGFTLLEVMVALIIGMIGLLGTVAVQQTVLNASQNANDSAIAMRLAIQQLEEMQVRRTTSAANDEMAAVATNVWNGPQFIESNGHISGVQTPAARWSRQWRISNVGVNLPYNLSVLVTYSLDSGNPKTIRLDVERRKSW